MVGDVDGKVAVIVDDMISTGGTLVAAAEMLKERGEVQIIAAATHGIFAGTALQQIADSAIEQVFVTDTMPLSVSEPSAKLDVVTVAPMIAEAIMRIHKDLSISALFSV